MSRAQQTEGLSSFGRYILSVVVAVTQLLKLELKISANQMAMWNRQAIDSLENTKIHHQLDA